QVWVAHLAAKPTEHAATKVERLTKDDVWYGDPQWSPDGKALVVHCNRTADRESVRYSINHNFDLVLIAATGKQRQLTRGAGPEVSPRFSPDGKSIACLSVPRRGSHRDVFNLAIVTGWDTDKPSMRVLFDHHQDRDGKAPHPAPAFPLPV